MPVKMKKEIRKRVACQIGATLEDMHKAESECDGELCLYPVDAKGECQDFCVWGGYSRGSPTRLPFVFCDAVCQT